MEGTIFTIGYQGLNTAELSSTLMLHGVTLLIDVRRRAMSRKPGFSRSALSAELGRSGLAYRHVSQLGSPDDIRQQLGIDHDYGTFFRAYSHAARDEAEALESVEEWLETDVICLMCFEASPLQCHRSVLANILARRNSEMKVVHLGRFQRDPGRVAD